jgi:hypothetical protein
MCSRFFLMGVSEEPFPGFIVAGYSSEADMAEEYSIHMRSLWHNICCLVQAIHELGVEPTFGSERTIGSDDELEQKLFA